MAQQDHRENRAYQDRKDLQGQAVQLMVTETILEYKDRQDRQDLKE